jgi:hypothetical protein
MARDYALKLKEELSLRKVDVPVIMGGVLNQKVANQELPVSVVQDLRRLGFHPAAKLEGQLPLLLAEKL